jgi:hypothetical protein
VTAVVISQPMLFPWPGFFELISLADIYVHLDDTQFSKGSFINRVQLKHPLGPKWMTIPLSGKGSFQLIHDLKPNGSDWKRRHRALLTQVLQGAPHIGEALKLFDYAYETERSIAELLMLSITMPTAAMGLTRPFHWLRASELAVSGVGSDRVLAIVKAVGGARYITGHGAANYLKHEAFETAGIEVAYVNYSLTPYKQLHGPFTPFVSVLDLLANLGPGPRARLQLQPRTVPWREFISNRQRFVPVPSSSSA